MRWFLAAVITAALALAACGDDETDPGDGGDPEGLPTVAPTSVSTAPSLPVESDGNAPGIPPLDGEIVETSTGLGYIDEVVGTGPTPPSANTCVTVHYTGWLTDGTKFDSSVDRGVPATFPLSGVITGWTEGVGSMSEGGKRRLIIPADLAYGASGRPPTIPGGATLIFDVELITVGGEAVDQGGRPTCPA